MISDSIDNFLYTLPKNRIAEYPLPERDKSKLLISGPDVISDEVFENIYKYILPQTTIVFNKTKVVKARMIFSKETGAIIEIFCLAPVKPTSEISLAYAQTDTVVWKCLVGNAKKWKHGVLQKLIRYNDRDVVLSAKIIGKEQDAFLVELSWDEPSLTFADILEIQGQMPLPPYIHRKAEAIDATRYQTVYATEKGSVAAPTAGLHFTPETLKGIKDHCKGITYEYVTLHVGAGTFKPVDGDINQHIMHYESLSVSAQTISLLLENFNKGPLLAIGTTSVRTLESLYWIGLNIINKKDNPFDVSQFQAYEKNTETCVEDSLGAVLEYLTQNDMGYLTAQTGIMIVPGYRFRIVNQLLTNFHQPGSTLILLVAAFIGDRWKEVYAHALNNNYRFLSYGDACLLSP